MGVAVSFWPCDQSLQNVFYNKDLWHERDSGWGESQCFSDVFLCFGRFAEGKRLCQLCFCSHQVDGFVEQLNGSIQIAPVQRKRKKLLCSDIPELKISSWVRAYSREGKYPFPTNMKTIHNKPFVQTWKPLSGTNFFAGVVRSRSWKWNTKVFGCSKHNETSNRIGLSKSFTDFIRRNLSGTVWKWTRFFVVPTHIKRTQRWNMLRKHSSRHNFPHEIQNLNPTRGPGNAVKWLILTQTQTTNTITYGSLVNHYLPEYVFQPPIGGHLP